MAKTRKPAKNKKALKGKALEDALKIKVLEDTLRNEQTAYETNRQRLLNELNAIRRSDEEELSAAAKEARKIVGDDVKRLKKMCKATFKKDISIKINIDVHLGMYFGPNEICHEESDCAVKAALPKNMSFLHPFFDGDFDNGCLYGSILRKEDDYGENILPELNEHFAVMRSLHGKIMKRIRQEYDRRDLCPDLFEEFAEMVLDGGMNYYG